MDDFLYWSVCLVNWNVEREVDAIGIVEKGCEGSEICIRLREGLWEMMDFV